MTPFRFYVARLGQAFGISFVGRHSSRAAAELHLLREAEEILGGLTWENVQDIEDLSVEYWNLRRLSKESAELAGQLEAANTTLQQSHEDRASILEKVVDSTKDLVEERQQLVETTERLASERDAILREARLVKRRHDGIKAKLEVLHDEGAGDPETVAASEKELADLKRKFKSLRGRRDDLASRIAEIDAGIEELAKRIEKRRGEIREEAFGSYQDIGKTNRDISKSRAQLGILESEMALLFGEVGRYLSTKESVATYRDLLRPHRALIAQMHALRTSIELNSQLSARGDATPAE